MTQRSANQVTELLRRWREGDGQAMEQLAPLIYDELRKLARSYLRGERPGPTLETGALVHDAYLRLVDQNRVEWQSRAHFYALAAQMMRRILVDHARRHGSHKRGGGARRVSLEEALRVGAERPPDLVALDDALETLAEVDPEKSRIVALRFFGGLSHPDIAEVLGVSVSSVERQWRMARAWLKRTLAAEV